MGHGYRPREVTKGYSTETRHFWESCIPWSTWSRLGYPWPMRPDMPTCMVVWVRLEMPSSSWKKVSTTEGERNQRRKSQLKKGTRCRGKFIIVHLVDQLTQVGQLQHPPSLAFASTSWLFSPCPKTTGRTRDLLLNSPFFVNQYWNVVNPRINPHFDCFPRTWLWFMIEFTISHPMLYLSFGSRASDMQYVQELCHGPKVFAAWSATMSPVLLVFHLLFFGWRPSPAAVRGNERILWSCSIELFMFV